MTQDRKTFAHKFVGLTYDKSVLDEKFEYGFLENNYLHNTVVTRQ